MSNIYALEFAEKGIKNEQWDLVDIEKALENFVTLYLTINNFRKIIILNSGYKYLRNRNSFGINEKQKILEIKSLEIALSYKNEIIKACSSHGHMAVLFVYDNTTDFLLKFLENDYFDKGEQINLGKVNKSNLIEEEQIEYFSRAVSSIELNVNTNLEIIVFSHDAEYFYKIYKFDND